MKVVEVCCRRNFKRADKIYISKNAPDTLHKVLMGISWGASVKQQEVSSNLCENSRRASISLVKEQQALMVIET